MIRARQKKHTARPEGKGQHLRLWYKALGRKDPVKTVQRPGLEELEYILGRSRAAEGCQGMAFQEPTKGEVHTLQCGTHNKTTRVTNSF